MDNVRNQVGNPLAGIDPNEIVDTRPYTNLLSQFITANSHGNPDFTDIKWNVCVVGTHDLYEHQLINDLAYMSANKDGRFGFNLLVEGFFSPKSCKEAIYLDAWVPSDEDEVLPLCKAVLEAYRDLRTQGTRQKTRMMWLINELGVEGFRAEVEKRLQNGKLERGSGRPLLWKRYSRKRDRGMQNQKMLEAKEHVTSASDELDKSLETVANR